MRISLKKNDSSKEGITSDDGFDSLQWKWKRFYGKVTTNKKMEMK